MTNADKLMYRGSVTQASNKNQGGCKFCSLLIDRSAYFSVCLPRYLLGYSISSLPQRLELRSDFADGDL